MAIFFFFTILTFSTEIHRKFALWIINTEFAVLDQKTLHFIEVYNIQSAIYSIILTECNTPSHTAN